MRVLRSDHNLSWLPANATDEHVVDHQPPPAELITSALALIFSEDQKILEIHHQNRGWDIPGGHLEVGELPSETLRREVMEEENATIWGAEQFGYLKINLPNPPDGWRYPTPISYQLLFVGWLKELLPAAFQNESTARRLSKPVACTFDSPMVEIAANYHSTVKNLFIAKYYPETTPSQRRAKLVIDSLQIFERLAPFNPAFVDSISLGVDTGNSDLDTTCSAQDHRNFVSICLSSFSTMSEFTIGPAKLAAQATVARFVYNDLPVEIFCSTQATDEQRKYLHYRATEILLDKHGEKLRETIVALKSTGVKTEPAVTAALGISGDPYLALLAFDRI